MKKQTIIAALLLATTMSHGKTTPNRTETPANFEGYLFAYFEGRGDRNTCVSPSATTE